MSTAMSGQAQSTWIKKDIPEDITFGLKLRYRVASDEGDGVWVYGAARVKAASMTAELNFEGGTHTWIFPNEDDRVHILELATYQQGMDSAIRLANKGTQAIDVSNLDDWPTLASDHTTRQLLRQALREEFTPAALSHHSEHLMESLMTTLADLATGSAWPELPGLRNIAQRNLQRLYELQLLARGMDINKYQQFIADFEYPATLQQKTTQFLATPAAHPIATNLRRHRARTRVTGSRQSANEEEEHVRTSTHDEVSPTDPPTLVSQGTPLEADVDQGTTSRSRGGRAAADGLMEPTVQVTIEGDSGSQAEQSAVWRESAAADETQRDTCDDDDAAGTGNPRLAVVGRARVGTDSHLPSDGVSDDGGIPGHHDAQGHLVAVPGDSERTAGGVPSDPAPRCSHVRYRARLPGKAGVVKISRRVHHPKFSIYNPVDRPPCYPESALTNAEPRDNFLELSRFSGSKLDLAALVSDFPELTTTVGLITDPQQFRDMFVTPLATSTPKMPAPLSRDMIQHTDKLVQDKVAERASRRQVRIVSKAFLVRKRNGQGRFILDLRRLNALQRKAPPMALPKIHEFIATILSWDTVAQCDGKVFFSQFELHPEIREYFGMKLAGRRGHRELLRLQRMPMGWQAAPAIAQSVANALTRDVGLAWVDNFVVGGASADFAARRQTFLDRIKKYNVEVDDSTMRGDTMIDVIGLSLDLTSKRYRLQQEWVDRQVAEFDRRGTTARSIREWFASVGALVWASYTKQQPLYMHAEMLACISDWAQIASRHGWDSVVPLPEYARHDFVTWYAFLQDNKWQTISEERSFQHDVSLIKSWPKFNTNGVVFADASDTAAAFVHICDDEIITAQQWPVSNASIFVSEVDALLQASTVLGTAIPYATDNQAAHYAMAKGHSSSYFVNCMLRRHLKGHWLATWWVPTAQNLADPFTRGFAVQTGVPFTRWVSDVHGESAATSSKTLDWLPWQKVVQKEDVHICPTNSTLLG